MPHGSVCKGELSLIQRVLALKMGLGLLPASAMNRWGMMVNTL